MLEKLLFYHQLSENALLVQNDALRQQKASPDIFYRMLFQEAEKRGLSGNLWHSYLLDNILRSENIISKKMSLGEELTPPLRAAAEKELETLQKIFFWPLPKDRDDLCSALAADFPGSSLNFCHSSIYADLLQDWQEKFTVSSPAQLVDDLEKFHRLWGYGEIVPYTFFTWRDELYGLGNGDTISLEQLFGYERQKNTVLTNTMAFLKGKRGNNLLLYGEKGTGKSSLIKAVVNNLAPEGLRLLALSRQDFSQLDKVLEKLSYYKQKFIIFLDDLSFEKDEKEYKYLKTFIEGGITSLPDNVLLYATSNRRHLVAESWKDRENLQEDLYMRDTESEKMALAQRFGITITFWAPDKDEFLQIVAGIAEDEKINIPQDELYEKALIWVLWHNSRSGRTARQFINDLLTKID